MLGCYEIEHSSLQTNEPDLPRRIELTAIPRDVNSAAVQQWYNIRSLDQQGNGAMWAWLPLREAVRVSLGNGFVGWELALHRAQPGMAGTARAYSDASGWGREIPVVLHAASCR